MWHTKCCTWSCIVLFLILHSKLCNTLSLKIKLSKKDLCYNSAVFLNLCLYFEKSYYLFIFLFWLPRLGYAFAWWQWYHWCGPAFLPLKIRALFLSLMCKILWSVTIVLPFLFFGNKFYYSNNCQQSLL